MNQFQVNALRYLYEDDPRAVSEDRPAAAPRLEIIRWTENGSATRPPGLEPAEDEIHELPSYPADDFAPGMVAARLVMALVPFSTIVSLFMLH